MAQAAVETLSQGVGRTPLHHQAVEVQAKHDVADRGTAMTPYRPEMTEEEIQRRYVEAFLDLQTGKRFLKEYQRQQEKKKEREQARAHTSASSSGLGNVAKDLGGLFNSVASGLGSVMKPSMSSGVYGYSSPVKSNLAQPAQTPPQGSRSRDKSEQPKVKSEPKSKYHLSNKQKANLKAK